MYAYISPRSVTSDGGTQLMLTPSVNGKVDSCCSSFTDRITPFLLLSTIWPGSRSASSVGMKTVVSLPAAGFHMAACGPASARLAGDPDTCTLSVRTTRWFAVAPSPVACA